MVIDKNLSKYIVFSEESLKSALQKISANEERIIFTVSDSGVLEGILTDGDFRRWVIEQKNVDLSLPVSRVANPNFRYAVDEDSEEKIDTLFSAGFDFVPILDRKKHFVALARKRKHRVRIGSFTIDQNSPAFVIAEIGNNHNGSFELAKKLVDEAIASGADCVKFQMRNLKTLYRNFGNPADAREDLGSQYTLDLLSRFQLPPDELFKIFDYCNEKGILPLCTPWDIDSLQALDRYGMQGFKIASADLINHELLEAVAKTAKPIICSTGMSTDQEIEESVSLMKKLGVQYVLLHCNSTYPAPFKDVNLNYMDRLREIGECPVGYSGHERGFTVPIAAVARGAKVIEKHFTLDRTMEGNDHKVSLLPQEFKAMVQGIRDVEQAMGDGKIRKLSQGELINREVLGKSLVINRDLKKGDMITTDMIEVKSPGVGLAPYRKPDLVGMAARRDFKAGDFFFPADLKSGESSEQVFRFKRPWGVPARYHDYTDLARVTGIELLEFHLSYKDLDEKLESFFTDPLELDLVVHSPELFAGDHILDLCSEDLKYRERSIKELQRVIHITQRLKAFFPRTKRPPIVVNAGGFTQDTPLTPSDRRELYDVILQSVSKLDQEGVEVIFQTMPPFPWHYGGQRYQNLFIDPSEIVKFCSETGYRICLDISHSKLACNYFKWSFKEFIEKVGPFTAHIHLADAEGVDGEGLQIGKGDIDFAALAEDLERAAPKASFIPEVWQGHKNKGEGFWLALERLERWF